MRRIIGLLATGAVLGVVIGKLLRRRRRVPEGSELPTRDPRAAELRARLEAARHAAPDRRELASASGAPSAPAEMSPPSPEAGLDEARRRVHERGRAAVEAMRRAAGR